MAQSNENHMFVSHYHEDENHINGLKELLGTNVSGSAFIPCIIQKKQ